MADNRNFNNDFCGSVPLHNINLIQDYGYLVVIGIDSKVILQASENFVELVDKPVPDIVNTSFEDLIWPESIKQLDAIIAKGITERIPLSLVFQHNNTKVQAILHLKKDYFILELEKSREAEERHFTNVFQDLKHSIAIIESAATVKEACETAISELRKISGFDGVLMYQFDKDWNGTVIAETKDSRLEPYMGQTFPASDIPKQARDLYLKNPYRLIPNREFKPIRLFPVLNPLTHAFIDMSDCNLRSVPAVHLEYMKNMGIKASMSIRVIRNEKLWGLISCHNIEPVTVNFEICSIFELFSSVISNKITSILNKEEFDQTSHLQDIKSALIDRVYTESDIVKGLTTKEPVNILDLFNATGMAILLDNKLETIGNVPEPDAIQNLGLWLEGKNINKVFSSDNLSGLYEEALEYTDLGSGLLVVPIDGNKGDYVICFRPEIVETINWGGNPNEALTFEPNGKNYHPRNSFKLWQQRVRNTSSPWQFNELEIAESLRSFLFEFRTRQIYY
ncbi:MAG: GAF domain-containing protein [Mucilaginibacter sp.]